MTVADSRNNVPTAAAAKKVAARRPAHGILGREVLGGEGRRKVEGDIADLIIMSTLDDKAPAEMPGSAALLDTLVEAHLGGAGVLETELPSAAEETTPSNDQHMQLLQREIELLLRDPGPADEGVAAPEVVVPAEAVAEVVADAPVAAAVGAVAAEDVAAVTQGEIDALLPPVAEVAAEEDPALTEAEGVLAQELAQLMADSQVKVEGAGDQAMVAEAPAAVAAAAVEAEGGVAGEMAAVEGGAFEAPPVVVELPEEAEEEVAVVRVGVMGRVRGVMANVALLMAQVFDMPFSWIGAAEKNILGVVAFMLLVSGVVLYVMAWVYR